MVNLVIQTLMKVFNALIFSSKLSLNKFLYAIIDMVVPGSAPGHLMASTPAIRSTPKTTAAQRFRAHYIANSTPAFSPKKKLNFEFHDSPEKGKEYTSFSP